MRQWVRRRRESDPPPATDTGRIRAVLSMGGVPWQDLDDAVQQVRLKQLEHRAASAEPVRDPAAWTAVVATRVAIDWHRSRQRQERLAHRMSALRAPGVPTVPDPGDRELALVVAELLDDLPAEQRQLLILRFFADLTVPQIAAALGVAQGTVKSRLHAAVGQMRARLGANEVS